MNIPDINNDKNNNCRIQKIIQCYIIYILKEYFSEL